MAFCLSHIEFRCLLKPTPHKKVKHIKTKAWAGTVKSARASRKKCRNVLPGRPQSTPMTIVQVNGIMNCLDKDILVLVKIGY